MINAVETCVGNLGHLNCELLSGSGAIPNVSVLPLRANPAVVVRSCRSTGPTRVLTITIGSEDGVESSDSNLWGLVAPPVFQLGAAPGNPSRGPVRTLDHVDCRLRQRWQGADA